MWKGARENPKKRELKVLGGMPSLGIIRKWCKGKSQETGIERRRAIMVRCFTN